MDWDLLVRLGKRWPLHYEPAYFGCLRQHETAKTSSGGGKRIREVASVLSEHTGKRWPIGLVVYGLGTYSTMAAHAVRGWPWEKWLHFLMSQATNVAAGLFVRRLPGWHQRGGWYADGACAPQIFFVLRPASGTLILEGSVPKTGWLNGQRLGIAVNGERLASVPVKDVFRLELPVAGRHEERLVLEITATLEVVPTYDAPHLEGGTRRTAYYLKRIEWNGWEFFPDGGSRAVEVNAIEVPPSSEPLSPTLVGSTLQLPADEPKS